MYPIFERVIKFVEDGQQHLGKKVTITQHLSISKDNFDRHFTTSARFSFILIDLRPRFSGNKIMFSGENFHYEIHGDNITEISRENSNYALIVEKLSENVSRKTEVHFATP